MTEIQKQLFAMQDVPYRDFQVKLIPGIDPEHVIGVRTPALRSFAKQLAKTPEAESFLHDLPHTYFDENQLHAFILSEMKDYDALLEELERFLPHIDNWATCDQLSPKVFAKHPELIGEIRRWMDAAHPYTVRFGIGMLMRWYLDAAFQPEYLEWVAAVESDEYYVNMMRAWYFATALAKQYDAAVGYFETHRLDAWTHSKALQKARESFRVSDTHKAYLQTLKTK